MEFSEIKKLSNIELIERTKRYVTVERQCVTHQIVLISLIKGRNLHVLRGYSNLADFLADTFAMTKDQAIKRARIASAAGFFPQILEPLKRGEATLSSLSLAAPRLTAANCEIILEGIKGKSKRQVMEFLPTVNEKGEIHDAEPVYEIKIRGDEKLVKTLERLRQVLTSRGKHPTNAQLIAIAAEDCLEKRDPLRRARRAEKRKTKKMEGARNEEIKEELKEEKKCSKPQNTAPKKSNQKKTRTPIPAAVKHEVQLRDGGQCTYVTEEGERRCSERAMVEEDHIVPIRLGGKNTVENLRLRCRAHNNYTAEVELGGAFMAKKRGDKRTFGDIMLETLSKAAVVPEPLDMRELGLEPTDST